MQEITAIQRLNLFVSRLALAATLFSLYKVTKK